MSVCILCVYFVCIVCVCVCYVDVAQCCWTSGARRVRVPRYTRPMVGNCAACPATKIGSAVALLCPLLALSAISKKEQSFY